MVHRLYLQGHAVAVMQQTWYRQTQSTAGFKQAFCQKPNKAKQDIRREHFYKTANMLYTVALTNSVLPWESLWVFCAWKEFPSLPYYTFPDFFAGRALQGYFISR